MATGVSKKKWNGEVNDNSQNGGEIKLAYDNKKTLDKVLSVKPFNFKSIDKFESVYDSLWYGDNLGILSLLCNRFELFGKVQLIYIDPPFATKQVFQTRNHSADAYEDTLYGASYIEFMRERLIWMRELLSNEGILFLHIDQKMLFHLKIILDEVFGEDCYINLITRQKSSPKNYTSKSFGNVSDYILVYSKTQNYTWHKSYKPWSKEKIEKEYPYIDQNGRRYKKVPIHAPGTRNGETGMPWKGMNPPPGKHWQYRPSKLDELDKNGHIYWSKNGNPRRKVYFDESQGIAVQDIWLDTIDPKNQNTKITGYPTEKNIDLIKRIIRAGSNKGDLILDAFVGSGTTLQAARETGRKWIGIDNSPEAIRTCIRRLNGDIHKMGDFVKAKRPTQLNLDLNNKEYYSLLDTVGNLAEELNGKGNNPS